MSYSSQAAQCKLKGTGTNILGRIISAFVGAPEFETCPYVHMSISWFNAPHSTMSINSTSTFSGTLFLCSKPWRQPALMKHLSCDSSGPAGRHETTWRLDDADFDKVPLFSNVDSFWFVNSRIWCFDRNRRTLLPIPGRLSAWWQWKCFFVFCSISQHTVGDVFFITCTVGWIQVCLT